jgi:hypothetical protein
MQRLVLVPRRWNLLQGSKTISENWGQTGTKRRHPLTRCNAALLVIAIALLPATASALSVAGGATWGTPGNNGQELMLGPTNSQTCILSGVSGDFIGNPTIYGKPGSFLPASAEIIEKGGFWFLRTRAGGGTGVIVYAICINATTNREEFSWSNNISTQGVKAAGFPNRHCFLKGVWATSGLSGQVGALQTNLTIKKVGDEFDMNDSYVQNVGGDTDFGGATAVCVDIVPTAQWGFTFTGPTNAAHSATTTVTLRNSFPNGAPVSVANVGCFLTGIAGRWYNGSPDPLGWKDGAFLTGDPKVSPNWLMTVSNGRQGLVSCLK